MNIISQYRNRKLVSLVVLSSLILTTGLMAFRKDVAKSENNVRSNATGSKNPSFLFLSDVHLNTTSATTTYGGDTGMELWAAFLNKVKSLLSGPDAPQFIVYSGDLPAHYSCSSTCYLAPGQRTGHNNNLDSILQGLHDLAEQYHKPLFYLPGNNDALAGDYYSFADEQKKTPLSLVPSTPLFFPKSSGGSVMNTAPCMVSDPHPTLGYYSARPVKGLRLIALNTVIYNKNFTTVDGTNQRRDGNMQMMWLASQLAEAEKNKEKVYIAMHIPPGTDAYSGNPMWASLDNNVNWQNAFLNLADRYKATISGILYGHTHMEEVRRLYDSTGNNVTEVAISCPGVTPQHYNNPGFKTVQYDATSMELTDFTTYYTLPSQTVWGDSSYSFSKVYGMLPKGTIYKRLSSMPINRVGNRMYKTFTVKNGPPGYDITTGIEVKKQ